MEIVKNKIKIILIVVLLNLIFIPVENIYANQPEITATLNAIPQSYSGECPTAIKFEGEITVKNIKTPVKVQYRFIRSDGSVSGHPITLTFDKDGSIKVSTSWRLSRDYQGWQAIKINYPQEIESNRANFKIQCYSEPKPNIKHDLTIKMDCAFNQTIGAGQFLNTRNFSVKATNNGEEAVKDVIFDIVLRSDTSCPTPAPLAVYSPKYSNGVLLLGGRDRISLGQGQSRVLILAKPIKIPLDTKEGIYYLCSVIDAGNKFKESNEENNCSCCRIFIEPYIRITGFKEKCIKKGGNITILGKNFGTQKGKSVAIADTANRRLVLNIKSWSDEEIVAVIPHYDQLVRGTTWIVGIESDDHTEWLSNYMGNFISVCR